ncbi:MAG: hypothetical protein R6X19_00945 [Kiritimatiellia bacterium]
MPNKLGLLFIMALAVAPAATGATDATVEKSFATAAEFDSFFRDSAIDLQAAPGAVTLRQETGLSAPIDNATAGAGNEGASVRAPRYSATGLITSPVIDMADPGKGGSIVPLFKIRSLAVQWRAIVPGSASVKIEARSGAAPWPDAGWSPWRPAENALPARFVQVRAVLVAGSGVIAPALTRLTVIARGETGATAESQGLLLRDFRNPPFASGSQTNAEPSAPYLILTASETAGVITVLAETVTPHLQSFRFAASGRDPAQLPGEGPDPDSRGAAYAWRLEPGVNTLCVTTVNRFGREGRPATVTVEWKQP